MSSAIQINPKTGKKSFNTRAAKANDKITGKGYSTIRDEKLTSLPPVPLGAVFSAVEQEKYIVYHVLYYIYQKTVFFGNTQFVFNDLPIDVELTHSHFPIIDSVVTSNFVDNIFKMKNNEHDLYEDAYLNCKFILNEIHSIT